MFWSSAVPCILTIDSSTFLWKLQIHVKKPPWSWIGWFFVFCEMVLSESPSMSPARVYFLEVWWLWWPPSQKIMVFWVFWWFHWTPLLFYSRKTCLVYISMMFMSHFRFFENSRQKFKARFSQKVVKPRTRPGFWPKFKISTKFCLDGPKHIQRILVGSILKILPSIAHS